MIENIGRGWNNGGIDTRVSRNPTGSNFVGSRAAILDGLYNTAPNEAFIKNLTDFFEELGFDVDVYKGEKVTINLLLNIGGYDILVLRLHSAIYVDDFLYLYSGEHYSESKYVMEQLSGGVRKGYTLEKDEPAYFVLNAIFLASRVSQGLNGSRIIVMGCNGASIDSTTLRNLFNRGAKAYVGWNGYVDVYHSDKATLRLISALYSENSSLPEAIERTISDVGVDPFYKTTLEYYTRAPR